MGDKPAPSTEKIRELANAVEDGGGTDELYRQLIESLNKNMPVLMKSTDLADIRLVAQLTKLLAPATMSIRDENGNLTTLRFPAPREFESRKGKAYHLPTAEVVREEVSAQFTNARHSICEKTCALISAAKNVVGKGDEDKKE